MAYVTAALKSFISIFGKKIKIILAVFAAIAALLLVLALLLGLAHLVQYAENCRCLSGVVSGFGRILGKRRFFLGNGNPFFVADHSGVGDLAGAGGI